MAHRREHRIYNPIFEKAADRRITIFGKAISFWSSRGTPKWSRNYACADKRDSVVSPTST